METTHPNIEVLQKFDPTNIASAVNILAEDAIFHYINPNLPHLEGDYVGLKGFQTFFKTIGAISKGTFKVNPITAYPIGEELVVVHSRNDIVLEDKQMEVDVVVVWRIVDGKIREVWDIPSTHHVNIRPVV
ncbi:nuclear transport factor 2 family protein [Sungkyunkwania multivorans]|uniref:Nuclear transport factor 2 family protein n=1 Tax=Sungkyunkwania multivorans TaxID=1173618 RepID=A0ABW3CWD6_9FLAO